MDKIFIILWLCIALLVRLTRFIILYRNYKDHLLNFSHLTQIRKQLIERLKNPRPTMHSTKPRRGRPTDAERKRREEARRLEAERREAVKAKYRAKEMAKNRIEETQQSNVE